MQSTPPPAAPPRPRIAVIAGTRPECLKLASLVAPLRAAFDVYLVNSGQHPEMVARTFEHLGIRCDVTLPPPPAPATLSRTVRHLRDGVRLALESFRPDAAIVQGDTSTAYAGALAARIAKVPLAHVEAGLRTHDPVRPFPEEPFRRRIAPIARWHFAPTMGAKANLMAEDATREVHVVGNTIIDLLRENLAARDAGPCPVRWREKFRTLVTLTLHRRENYGRGLDTVCEAMREVLDDRPDVGLVCPVHPNPTVGARVRRVLSGHHRAILTEPMPYRPFLRLLGESTLVVTDSGGIQEEAPYLGVPALVVREETERPECLATGFVRLVPPHRDRLRMEIERALDLPRPRAVPFDDRAPFGDGRSGARIAAILAQSLARTAATA